MNPYSAFAMFAGYFTYYMPFTMLLTFLVTWLWVKLPGKGAFLGRALLALVIAVFLAHVNRIFLLYPPHPLFPSGHTTMCFGLALSIAMLRPWTLALTLPLIAILGISMVALHFHSTVDILGAFPLVLVIYGIVHFAWRLPSDSPLLDRVTLST